MRGFCWGHIDGCNREYAASGQPTAYMAGSSRNRFIDTAWTKTVTLKLQNKATGKPLTSEMIYKVRADFASSSIWRQFLGFSAEPGMGAQNMRIFEVMAPEVQPIGLSAKWEGPNGEDQVAIGQTVECFVRVENKQNEFRMNKLSSVFSAVKADSFLAHSAQNVDVRMIPVGNGKGKEDSIGLEVIKDTVQIVKEKILTKRSKRYIFSLRATWKM